MLWCLVLWGASLCIVVTCYPLKCPKRERFDAFIHWHQKCLFRSIFTVNICRASLERARELSPQAGSVVLRSVAHMGLQSDTQI